MATPIWACCYCGMRCDYNRHNTFLSLCPLMGLLQTLQVLPILADGWLIYKDTKYNEELDQLTQRKLKVDLQNAERIYQS